MSLVRRFLQPTPQLVIPLAVRPVFIRRFNHLITLTPLPPPLCYFPLPTLPLHQLILASVTMSVNRLFPLRLLTALFQPLIASLICC